MQLSETGDWLGKSFLFILSYGILPWQYDTGGRSAYRLCLWNPKKVAIHAMEMVHNLIKNSTNFAQDNSNTKNSNMMLFLRSLDFHYRPG